MPATVVGAPTPTTVLSVGPGPGIPGCPSVRGIRVSTPESPPKYLDTGARVLVFSIGGQASRTVAPIPVASHPKKHSNMCDNQT